MQVSAERTQVRGLICIQLTPHHSLFHSRLKCISLLLKRLYNTWHAPEPFHLVRWSSVRQQVTPDNLILQPSEKQAPTNTCPLRTFLALPLAEVIPGLKDVSEGRCHAGCFDDDPENASAALGRQSKQAGFPRGGGRELRLPALLMLQWKSRQHKLSPAQQCVAPGGGFVCPSVLTLPGGRWEIEGTTFYWIHT